MGDTADWTCSCTSTNPLNHSKCHSCGAPRPAATGLAQPVGRVVPALGVLPTDPVFDELVRSLEKERATHGWLPTNLRQWLSGLGLRGGDFVKDFAANLKQFSELVAGRVQWWFENKLESENKQSDRAAAFSDALYGPFDPERIVQFLRLLAVEAERTVARAAAAAGSGSRNDNASAVVLRATFLFEIKSNVRPEAEWGTTPAIGSFMTVQALGDASDNVTGMRNAHGTLFFMRKEAVDLWSYLDTFVRTEGIRTKPGRLQAVHYMTGLVHGPPGTGKSSTVWAWACNQAALGRSVVWLHVDSSGGEITWALLGREKGSSGTVAVGVISLQDLISLFRHHEASPTLLLLDGVRQRHCDACVQAATLWHQNNQRYQTLLVTSQQLTINSNSDGHKYPSFEMHSWTLQQYEEACTNAAFRQQVYPLLLLQNPDDDCRAEAQQNDTAPGASQNSLQLQPAGTSSASAPPAMGSADDAQYGGQVGAKRNPPAETLGTGAKRARAEWTEQETLKLVRTKFRLAGSSARWMFATPASEVQIQIEEAVRRRSGTNIAEGSPPDRSLDAVNTLLGSCHTPGGVKTGIVSLYAQDLVILANNFNKALLANKLIKENPCVAGFAFEAYFLAAAHDAAAHLAAKQTAEPKSVVIFQATAGKQVTKEAQVTEAVTWCARQWHELDTVGLKVDSVNEFPVGHNWVQPGVWLHPTHWNNATFDAVMFPSVDHVCFVQCTIADHHSFDEGIGFAFVKKYEEKLKAECMEPSVVTQVTVVFVLEGTSASTAQTIADFKTPDIKMEEKGTRAHQNPRTITVNVKVVCFDPNQVIVALPRGTIF